MSGGPVGSGITREEREILSHPSIEMLPDGQGDLVKTLRLTRVNFQIVNGLGATATINGHGNSIAGYNELGNPRGDGLSQHRRSLGSGFEGLWEERLPGLVTTLYGRDEPAPGPYVRSTAPRKRASSSR